MNRTHIPTAAETGLSATHLEKQHADAVALLSCPRPANGIMKWLQSTPTNRLELLWGRASLDEPSVHAFTEAVGRLDAATAPDGGDGPTFTAESVWQTAVVLGPQWREVPVGTLRECTTALLRTPTCRQTQLEVLHVAAYSMVSPESFVAGADWQARVNAALAWRPCEELALRRLSAVEWKVDEVAYTSPAWQLEAVTRSGQLLDAVATHPTWATVKTVEACQRGELACWMAWPRHSSEVQPAQGVVTLSRSASGQTWSSVAVYATSERDRLSLNALASALQLRANQQIRIARLHELSKPQTPTATPRGLVLDASTDLLGVLRAVFGPPRDDPSETTASVTPVQDRTDTQPTEPLARLGACLNDPTVQLVVDTNALLSPALVKAIDQALWKTRGRRVLVHQAVLSELEVISHRHGSAVSEALSWLDAWGSMGWVEAVGAAGDNSGYADPLLLTLAIERSKSQRVAVLTYDRALRSQVQQAGGILLPLLPRQQDSAGTASTRRPQQIWSD